MDTNIKRELLVYLSTYATENKLHKIDTIAADRTKHVTVVMEDIFQTHNASAVVRSSDCFGVQDLYVIEKRNTFSPLNSVAKGSAKWVEFHNFKSTTSCFHDLKRQGYTVVATSPHKRSISLHELPIEKKVALVFGTESVGLSKEALDLADEFVTIPMFGFTESFNISVSVAVCLYDIMQRLRNSSFDWRLSEDELLDVKLAWVKQVVSGSEILEKKFLEEWAR